MSETPLAIQVYLWLWIVAMIIATYGTRKMIKEGDYRV